MKKAERLLDLITFLLNAHEPVTFEEIRIAFPEDYSEGSDEADIRKFERDKADILEIGLPLKLVGGDDHDKEGYIIERKTYALPPISLGPEEIALLFLAGGAALNQGVSPFSRDLVLALNKISFASESHKKSRRAVLQRALAERADVASATRQKEHLEVLHRALLDRKTVTLSYHGFWRDEITKRKVDPYGLVSREGTWILVGHCHLRENIRVFHLDRIRGLAINPLKPKTPDFEYPKNFTLSDYVAQEPWLIHAHDPIHVAIRFEPPSAAVAVAEIGASATRIECDNEARILHFEATYLDGLLPTILWYRSKAKVLSPPDFCEKVQGIWRRFAGVG